MDDRYSSNLNDVARLPTEARHSHAWGPEHEQHRRFLGQMSVLMEGLHRVEEWLDDLEDGGTVDLKIREELDEETWEELAGELADRPSVPELRQRVIDVALVPTVSDLLALLIPPGRPAKAVTREDWLALADSLSAYPKFRGNVYVYFLGLLARALGEKPGADELVAWWVELVGQHPRIDKSGECDLLGFVEKALACRDALREREGQRDDG